jgi:hypothetical protein
MKSPDWRLRARAGSNSTWSPTRSSCRNRLECDLPRSSPRRSGSCWLPDSPRRLHTRRRRRAPCPAKCRRPGYPSRNRRQCSARQSFPSDRRTDHRSPRGRPRTSGMFRSTRRFQTDTYSWAACQPCRRCISGALCTPWHRRPSPARQDRSSWAVCRWCRPGTDRSRSDLRESYQARTSAGSEEAYRRSLADNWSASRLPRGRWCLLRSSLAACRLGGQGGRTLPWARSRRRICSACRGPRSQEGRLFRLGTCCRSSEACR